MTVTHSSCFRYSVVLSALLVFALPPTSSFAQQVPDLFRGKGSPQAKSAEDFTPRSQQATERLQRMEELQTTAALRLVRLPNNLAQQPVVRITFDSEQGLAPDTPSRFQNEAAQKQKRARPKGRVNLFLRRDALDVIDDELVSWKGTVVTRPRSRSDFARNDSGEAVGEAMLVIHASGTVTGNITVDGEMFQIRALDNGLHALIDVNEQAYPEGGAGPRFSGRAAEVHESSAHIHAEEVALTSDVSEFIESGTCSASSSAPDLGVSFDMFADPNVEASAAMQWEASAPMLTCPREIDILVVYTAAAASGRDINGIINLAISELNESYNRSSVSNLDAELAHRQQISFSESSNILTDLNRLVSNGTVASLRNQHNADVVVLLTDGPYFGIAGVANEIRAEAGDAFAIVQAAFATGGLTFAHEVGHLQGGQHHPGDPTATPGDPFDDPENDLFTYGFGHRFSDKDCTLWIFCNRDYYSSVMAYTPDDYRRVKRFSNPSITYDSQATGTSSRNNARALRNTATTMSNFRDDNEMRAQANASGNISSGQYTFSASTCGTNGTVSYEWRIGYNGTFNYGGVLSTSQSFSTVLPTGTHAAKLTVTTSTGQSAVAYRSVYVQGDNCDSSSLQPLPCIRDEPLLTESAKGLRRQDMPLEFALRGAGPNPFRGMTELEYDVPEAAPVRIAVYDLLGRQVATLVDRTQTAGTHRVQFDGSGLASGVYLVRLVASGTVQTQRVSLVR